MKNLITYQSLNDEVFVSAGLLRNGSFVSQWIYMPVLLVQEWEVWWIWEVQHEVDDDGRISKFATQFRKQSKQNKVRSSPTGNVETMEIPQWPAYTLDKSWLFSSLKAIAENKCGDTYDLQVAGGCYESCRSQLSLKLSWLWMTCWLQRRINAALHFSGPPPLPLLYQQHQQVSPLDCKRVFAQQGSPNQDRRLDLGMLWFSISFYGLTNCVSSFFRV